MHNPKNIFKEQKLINSFENKIVLGDDKYNYILNKNDKKFMIQTNKPASTSSSTFRFENLDDVVLQNEENSIKIKSSNIRKTDDKNIIHYSVSEFCSADFEEDKKLKYKLIITYGEKIEIHYHDFFSNFEFMTYINSNVFGGIEFKIEEYTFEIYHLESFFVVKCSDEIDYVSFDRFCRLALAAFGFVTGFVPMGSGYYFGYESREYVQFLFSSTFYDTYKSQYKLLITNAYEFYQNIELEFSFENGKFSTDERVDNLSKKLKSMTRDSFEKLMQTMLDNSKFSEAVYSILSINNLKSFSVFLKTGLYAIVLEMITSIVANEKKVKEYEVDEILKDENRNLKKELQKKLNETAKSFYEENGLEFVGSIVSKRLNGIYNPLNSNKLIEAYELLDIGLSEQEKKNVNLRNKFLHGTIPYKDKDFKVLSSKLLYINLELNYLINALVLKYIGYNGFLKNLAKIYLDYKQLDELDGEEYNKNGMAMQKGAV